MIWTVALQRPGDYGTTGIPFYYITGRKREHIKSYLPTVTMQHFQDLQHIQVLIKIYNAAASIHHGMWMSDLNKCVPHCTAQTLYMSNLDCNRTRPLRTLSMSFAGTGCTYSPQNTNVQRYTHPRGSHAYACVCQWYA